MYRIYPVVLSLTLITGSLASVAHAEDFELFKKDKPTQQQKKPTPPKDEKKMISQQDERLINFSVDVKCSMYRVYEFENNSSHHKDQNQSEERYVFLRKEVERQDDCDVSKVTLLLEGEDGQTTRLEAERTETNGLVLGEANNSILIARLDASDVEAIEAAKRNLISKATVGSSEFSEKVILRPALKENLSFEKELGKITHWDYDYRCENNPERKHCFLKREYDYEQWNIKAGKKSVSITPNSGRWFW